MILIILAVSFFSLEADFWADRADCFAEQHEWVAAIDNADEAVRHDHRNPRRFLQRGAIKLQAGRMFQALADANRAEDQFRSINLHSAEPDRLRGAVYLGLARQEVDYLQLEYHLQKFHQQFHNAYPAAKIQYEQVEIEEDLAKQLELLTEAQEHLQAIKRLTPKLKQAQLRLEQAIQHFNRAIGRLPDSGAARHERDFALATAEEVKRAIKDIKQPEKQLDELAFKIDSAIESIEGADGGDPLPDGETLQDPEEAIRP